ncbi:MAG: hypothetical protein ABI673_00185 [Novosphingobium sp.]
MSILFAAGAMLPAACAPVSHVASSGAGRLPATVQLVIADPQSTPADAPANARLTRLAAQMTEALAHRGIAVTPDADYRVTLTLAERPAEIGVLQGRAEQAKPVVWLSAPTQRPLIKLCRRQITRISVSGATSVSALPQLTAYADLDSCGNGRDGIDQLARELVARLTLG